MKLKGRCRFLVYAILFCLLMFAVLSNIPRNLILRSKGNRDVNSSGHPTGVFDFDWSSIQASTKLLWTPCYDKFACSRLLVPLDHAKPEAKTAAIAIIIYPSAIPPGREGYRGPVLFNPGGPGSTGVQFVLGRADSFRAILGDGYDIVGFDPRGVGFTTPGLFSFFSEAESALFGERKQRSTNASADALASLYGTAQLLGQLVESRAKYVAEHISTSAVARDMLSIVKAFGREKLQYWGFSYGTVLGATFAAMFPENVGRIIIDAVVDFESYYAGLWSNNFRDTDKGLRMLYQACVDAGAVTCPIHESSVKKIETRVDALLEGLKSLPVSFYNEKTGAYGEVDYSTAKSAIFSALFRPHAIGRHLFLALSDLEKGLSEPIWRLSMWKIDANELSCKCPTVPHAPFAQGWEIGTAIACGDGKPVHASLDDVKAMYGEMAKKSSFTELWWRYIACSGWRIRTKESFTGIFDVNTSFPILLIGNTADPVSPILNAHKMSGGFKGSVVLTQDSPGHGSPAATSLCTARAIRAYFQDGILPKKGTVCEVQSSVFQSALIPWGQTLSSEDQKLLNASENLMESYFVPLL